MKTQKVLSLISNILLFIGAGLSVLAITLSFTVRASLPPGVCPIDNNRPLYFSAIAILIASFILSLYADRLKKRRNKS
jgi:hypothetical protein